MEGRNTGERIEEDEHLRGFGFGFTPLQRNPTLLSSGGLYGMGMRMFPFRAEQWQEFQRQAMIYKHMVASVHIPPDLLFPESPAIYLPSSMLSSGGMNLRLASGADTEPGRCRRTDGKKWRCARDAAPDQKYCERHLNRGRSRSRKPVEQRKTRNKVTTCTIADSSAIKSPEPDALPNPNIELNLPFRSLLSNDEPSAECGDWLKSYSANLTPKEQLEILHSKTGLKYEELPNLNYGVSSSWYPFLNSTLPTLDESNEPPRRFFDAWSSENNKQPHSALTLSIASAIEEGTEQIQLGWMASNSPLGGPLAEVLHSSNITSQESSPRDSPSRLVSSPSEVLQKTRVSLSDSSSSSSPTFAAASTSDFALQWMNLNN